MGCREDRRRGHHLSKEHSSVSKFSRTCQRQRYVEDACCNPKRSRGNSKLLTNGSMSTAMDTKE